MRGIIGWVAVLLSLVFLIVVGSATLTKLQAEKYAGLAQVEEARGIAYAREIAARGDAAIGLKQAQATMLLAALPYFLAFALFLFLGVLAVLIVQRQPGVTNNYILEVKYENNSNDRVRGITGGRAVRAFLTGGRVAARSNENHQRVVYDQKGIGDGKP